MPSIMVSELHFTTSNCEDANSIFKAAREQSITPKHHLTRNSEMLTIKRSLKPDQLSLESVVTAQHRFWVLRFASLLSTMGHLHGKSIFVSKSSSIPAAYSPCLVS